jgi:hypothetical protein
MSTTTTAGNGTETELQVASAIRDAVRPVGPLVEATDRDRNGERWEDVADVAARSIRRLLKATEGIGPGDHEAGMYDAEAQLVALHALAGAIRYQAIREAEGGQPFEFLQLYREAAHRIEYVLTKRWVYGHSEPADEPAPPLERIRAALQPVFDASDNPPAEDASDEDARLHVARLQEEAERSFESLDELHRQSAYEGTDFKFEHEFRIISAKACIGAMIGLCKADLEGKEHTSALLVLGADVMRFAE